MARRALGTSFALAFVAATGCGSGSSSPGNGLAEALQFVPKDAALVIVLDTNPHGDQWQQANELLGKLPFGDAVKAKLKERFITRFGADYDRDIKPIVGDDLVVALTLDSAGATHYIVSWHADDTDALKRFGGPKVGETGGADLVRDNKGELSAIKDSTIVATDTRAELDAAVARSSGEHMSQKSFEDRLGVLDKDALVRVTGDLQAALRSTGQGELTKIRWVRALRTFGATLDAQPDGLELAFDVKAAGGLRESDLPFASGSAAAPLVRRPGDISFGVRNPAQTYRYARSLARLTDPAGYASFQRGKARAGRRLGIDVDRDLISQLTGSASLSIALDGGFGMRAGVRNPAALVATLKKLAPRLNNVREKGAAPIHVVAPKGGEGLYRAANGATVAFGVVGKSFVLATDPGRAAHLAGESATAVPGTQGSLVIASDARVVAGVLARERGGGAAAQLLTGSLGDLVGSIHTETDGMVGKLKLFVK